MKEKKNIDRLFQEKFKDFEAHPSDAVWEKIAFAKAEKENKKVIPLWWRLGGIAAALALLIGLGSLFFKPTESESTVVDTIKTPTNQDQEEKTKENFANTTEQVAQEDLDKNEFKTDTDQKDNINSDQGLVETTAAQQNQTNSAKTTNNYNTTALSNNSVASQDKSSRPNVLNTQKSDALLPNNINKSTATVAADNPSGKNRKIISTSPSNTRENDLSKPNIITPSDNTAVAIAENNDDVKKDDAGKSLIETAQEIKNKKLDEAITVTDDTTPNNRRWDVGAVAAPVYYGDFGGSGIDPQFKDNGKSGDVNLSYGVQVSYAVSNKLKVRTGVSNVDLSYGTNGISFSPDISATRLAGVDYNSNARFLSVTDQVNNSDQLPTAEADNFQGGTSVSNGSLQQSLGYIEVPVEAVYTVSDKRLGIEVIGGMSTLFLNDNEIAIESQDGLRTPIGESNSLNDVSFTTNVGVGVNYKLTDKVKVNVEPTLKYQLNAFEGAAADFKPYYIGLYTGVSYRF